MPDPQRDYAQEEADAKAADPTETKALSTKTEKVNLQLSGAGKLGADELYRQAQIFFQTDVCPPSYKNAKQVMFALAKGQDLGWSPTKALQDIAIINNKPSIHSDGVMTLIHESGHLYEERFGGSIKDEDYWAEVTIMRKDTGSIITRRFDVDDAKRAGLWETEPMVTRNGRNGTYTKPNDSPWFKYPKRMIWRRASSWAMRDGCPDIMGGLAIVEEEEDHARIMQRSALAEAQSTAERKKGGFAGKIEAMAAQDKAGPEEPEDEDPIEDADFEDVDLNPEPEVDDAVSRETTEEAPETALEDIDGGGSNLPVESQTPKNDQEAEKSETLYEGEEEPGELLNNGDFSQGEASWSWITAYDLEKEDGIIRVILGAHVLDWIEDASSMMNDADLLEGAWTAEKAAGWLSELSEDERASVEEITAHMIRLSREGFGIGSLGGLIFGGSAPVKGEEE